jgi:hypothetical protein
LPRCARHQAGNRTGIFPNRAGLPLDDERESERRPISLSRLCRAVGVDCIEDSAADLSSPFPHQGTQFADFFAVVVFLRGVVEHRAHHFTLSISKFYRSSHALPTTATKSTATLPQTGCRLVAPLPSNPTLTRATVHAF